MYILIRSLYEIYCKIIFALRSKKNAIYLIESDLGLATGQFETLSINGKLKWNILSHKRSGRRIPRFRSFNELISASRFKGDIELFGSLYEFLSSFAHSGSRHAVTAWHNDLGFKLFNENDEDSSGTVALLASLIAAMIMQGLSKYKNLRHANHWDMSLFCYSVRHVIADTTVSDESGLKHLHQLLQLRAATFPRRIKTFAPKDS